ncbi:hypothetical protein GCM10027049_19370 [Mucilaginibacter puniceus]
MNILIDKELDLNQKDLLNTRSYAKSLKELILNAPSNTPMTIGLFGEWGSGKSSIIKTLTTDLKDSKKLRVKFVVYDAWKYANDSFRRMFLLKVQNALGLDQTSKMSSFYINKNTEVDIKRKFNLPFLTLITVALLMCLLAYSIISPHPTETITLAIILSILGFLANVFSKAFNEYKITTQEPYLFAPEQFEECFNEIVSKALKKSTGLEKISNYITGKEDGDIDKLIIVIDNIDRCHRETAYELLTNTKNFIDTRLDVVFLIPVDDNALKKHIFQGQAEGSKESEEFLRKYFNVTVRIKPYKVTEIFDFAANINEENRLGFKPDTVNIIAKEYASNPRRIIQFYNNLQIEVTLLADKYGKSFVEKNEIAICKFLIIREEWHKHYMMLCESPDLYFSDDYQALKETDTDGYASFLESTYISTRDITYDELQKILINSDNYDVLPDTILTKVKLADFGDFDEVLENAGYSKTRVIDFFLFHLKKSVKSKLFKTEVPDTLDHIYLVLTNLQDIDNSYFGRLESEIRKNINTHIGNAKSTLNLVKFSNYALKKGVSFMNDAIIKYFSNFEQEDDKFYDSPLFELYRDYYQNANENQLNIAAKGFPKYLNNTKLEDKLDRTIDSKKLETLYTESIIGTYLINTAVEFWNDQENISRWLFLADKLPEQNQLLRPITVEASRALNNNVNGNELLIQVLGNILKTSKNISSDDILISTLASINTSLFGLTRLPNGTVRQYLQQMSAENHQTTASYLIESYRATYGSHDTVTWITQLVSVASENIIKADLFTMITSYPDLTIVPLKQLINGFVEVSANTNNILLNALYREQDGNDYTDEEIKVHLSRILEKVKADPSNDDLLLAHLNHKRGQKIIADLLIESPVEEFKKLSIPIQSAAFDLMTDKANISRYKTNFELLNTIAQNGNKKHIKGLINTIKSNLIDQEHTEQTLQLITAISNIGKGDASDLASYIQTNKIADMGFKKETEKVLKHLNEVKD